MKNKKIELISPAGSWESLTAAINSGADAIYFGIKLLNMRANAKNFELNEIKKITDLCHKKSVKAYLTLNTIIYENETNTAEKIIIEAKKSKIDGIITWDFAIINLLKKYNIPIHLSTQASISNYEAVKFYANLGARYIVPARELNLKQIKEISNKIKKDNLNVNLETFGHGAMCVAISGRCFMSQFLYKHSANRGDCLQPCRREYNVYLIEDKETKKQLKLENHYVMSPKDLCTLPIIDKLIETGINAIKIEGRNRSPEYVKIVTETYRTAIDKYYKKELTEEIKNQLIKKLEEVYNRKFHTGFYLGTPTADDFTNLYGSNAKKKKIFIGNIKKVYNKINVIELKIESNQLKLKNQILITGKKTGAEFYIIEDIRDINDKQINIAKKGTTVTIKLNKKEIIPRIKDKIFLYFSTEK